MVLPQFEDLPAPAYEVSESPETELARLESGNSQAPPPSYPVSLPPSFRVGKHYTPPVVTGEELLAHLRILGAFHALRDQIRNEGFEFLRPDDAWYAFTARAVHRFKLWVDKVVEFEPLSTPSLGPDGHLVEDMIPPLDVLMIWHSYLLNPRAYYEDGLRSHPKLLALGGFPLIKISTLISPATLSPFPPSEARRRLFESRTSQPFFSHSIEIGETTPVACPWCEDRHQVLVPWLVENGTGYAQGGFKAICEYCKVQFDREALRTRRICDDIVRQRENPSTFYLAGTLLYPRSGEPNKSLAQALNSRAFIYFRRPEYKDISSTHLARAMNFRLNDVKDICRVAFKGYVPRRVNRIFVCYDSPDPFSVELTGAAIRQGNFIQSMADFGWTEPGFFNSSSSSEKIHQKERVDVLGRSVARYHAFMDMMSTGLTFYVPTLDIDLAWHTHQLKADVYRSQTMKFLAHIPDHDDKVAEGELSHGFEATAKAWKERFGVPYSVCGCAQLDAPNPIVASASTMSSKFGKLFKSNSSKATPSSQLPSSSTTSPDADADTDANAQLINTRPDILSLDDADADATHPSEHNSVLLIANDVSRQGRMRREKLADAKEIEAMKDDKGKGKADAWARINGERRERQGHGRPFMVPVPYWGVSLPGEYGFHGYGTECSLNGGRIITAGAACASGAKGPGVACMAGGCMNASGVAACGTPRTDFIVGG